MELWATEVKSGETFKVEPGQDKRLHLTQANLGEVKKGKSTESVQIFVNVDGKKLVLGTLISENLPNMQFDLVFDRDFELSHSWKGGSVYFFGYELDNVEDEEDTDDDSDIPLRLEDSVKAEKPVDKKVSMETANGLPRSDDDDSSDDDSSDDDSSDDDSSDDDSETGDDHSDVNEFESDSEGDSEDDSEDEDESEEDEPAKVEPGKKRASDSEPETPASKKKVKLTTSEKTDGKKGSGVHVDTSHPSKKAGKTSSATPNQKTKKSSGGGSRKRY